MTRRRTWRYSTIGLRARCSTSRAIADGRLIDLGCYGRDLDAPRSPDRRRPCGDAFSPDSQNVYVRTADGVGRLRSRWDRSRRRTGPQAATRRPRRGLYGHRRTGGSRQQDRRVARRLHVYVPFGSPGGISVFNRLPDGTLTQLTATSGGCISSDGTSNGVGDSCVNGNDGPGTARGGGDLSRWQVGIRRWIRGTRRATACNLERSADEIGCFDGTGCPTSTAGTIGVFAFGFARRRRVVASQPSQWIIVLPSQHRDGRVDAAQRPAWLHHADGNRRVLPALRAASLWIRAGDGSRRAVRLRVGAWGAG